MKYFQIWVILWCILWLPSACGEVATEHDEHMDDTHRVEYVLEWDTQGVALDADSFRLTSNVGYEIQVDAAYLVAFLVQMIPCDEEFLGLQRREKPVATPAWEKWWQRTLGMRVAHAGHGEDDVEVSAIEQSQVENLVEATTMYLGARPLNGGNYCNVHYLVAAGGTTAAGLPAEPNMVGTSLYLKGTWKETGAGEPTPFVVQTSSAYGILRGLQLSSHDPNATVTIQRSLGRLFDDVVWQEMSDTQTERQILENIVKSANVLVSLAE